MSRPNRCIKDENGEDQWISRSTVVIPIVFREDKETGDIYTLVEKRGPAVSHTGEWCCPCGYLDWDETLEEGCRREVEEETGLLLDLSKIKFYGVTTKPFGKVQAVDLWYYCWTDRDFDMNKVETKDEILDLKWLKVANVHWGSGIMHEGNRLDIYESAINAGYGKWAFKAHHKTMVDMLVKNINPIITLIDGQWKGR